MPGRVCVFAPPGTVHSNDSNIFFFKCNSDYHQPGHNLLSFKGVFKPVADFFCSLMEKSKKIFIPNYTALTCVCSCTRAV